MDILLCMENPCCFVSYLSRDRYMMMMIIYTNTYLCQISIVLRIRIRTCAYQNDELFVMLCHVQLLGFFYPDIDKKMT